MINFGQFNPEEKLSFLMNTDSLQFSIASCLPMMSRRRKHAKIQSEFLHVTTVLLLVYMLLSRWTHIVFKTWQDGTQPCIHGAHSRITVYSGQTVPRETGVVHGEVLCDALVPYPRRINTWRFAVSSPCSFCVYHGCRWLCYIPVIPF